MLGLGAHRVFVDSNVLYSRTLRDWLALIYLQGEQPPYAVYWTEDVLAELVYHLRRQHPDWNGGKISAIRDRLTKVFEVGRVADYPVAHAEAVRDKYDLHIHAAALACGADILLTSNVRDLPSAEQYDVMKPDEFFVLVDDAAPTAVRAATSEQAAFWGRRQGEVDLPGRLRSADCEQFAQRVLAHLRANALCGG